MSILLLVEFTAGDEDEEQLDNDVEDDGAATEEANAAFDFNIDTTVVCSFDDT